MHRLLALLPAVLLPGCHCDDPLAPSIPGLAVTPAQVELSNIPVGQDTDIVFTVRNDKLVEVHDVVASLAEPAPPAFRVLDGYPDAVLPGSHEEIVVRVRPTLVSTIEATLVVEAEPRARPNRVEIPITLEAVDAGFPDIDVSPATVVFEGVGRQSVGRTTVTIGNGGNATLILDEVRFVPDEEGDETLALVGGIPPGFHVDPGQVVSVEALFAPRDLLVHSGALQIASNDPDDGLVVVPMSGQGVECPTAVLELVDVDIDYEPLDLVRLYAGNSLPVDDDHPIGSYALRLLQRPVGSTASLVTNGSAADLVVDLAGAYAVSLHVFDVEGVRSCEPAVVTVDVVPTEDLVVQLVWDHPDADFDLHTVRGGGSAFTHEGDVYFSNKEPAAEAPWSENADENPILDHDDDEGYGPENMNVKHPAPGARFTLLVHYWNKQTDLDARTTATLRVFVYGQQVIELQRTFEDDEQLWTALDIVWPTEEGAPASLTQVGTVEPLIRPF